MDNVFKSYLVRAAYEYCIDHGHSPFLVASTDGNATLEQHAAGGQITLNLSNQAVRDFYIDRENLCFSTRFNGVVTYIKVPMSAVLWLGCPHNNCGVGFEVGASEPTSINASEQQAIKTHESKLRLV